MANQDSFIDEVSEEVRRDKLFALFRRYGWIPALAVVVIVGGAAFNEWRKASARAEAEASGDAIFAAIAAGDAESRAQAMSALAFEDPGRAAVARLLEAGALVEAGDTAGAVAALDAVAADSAVDQVYRDLAALKSLMIGAADLPAEERAARLTGLAQPGKAFRLLALEQLALAEIEMGERDAALDTLRGIIADAEVTQDLRRRASQLIVALGGALATG